jgi:hypothetical protein
MTPQACPNCHRAHDVSVFVTGQRVLCSCGIRFEVKRTDVSAPGRAPVPEASATPLQRPSIGNGGSTARDVAAAELEREKTFISQGVKPTLPGYEMLEVLGRGGMGEVWRSRQLSLGREVAVKILPPRLAKDPEFIARFEKEAAALAALSHPNIIQIIDRGVAGEHYFFVMEYVAGRSLREVMAHHPLAPQDALKVVAQICRAIECAHDKQIIHRDLKPENILVDPRGLVKVADFGLAGMHGPETGPELTATAVAMGTLNYMAPEQRRDAKHVDGRADLYSLGVILYELLTNELPLGRFKLPGERVPGLDPRVDTIVARVLETDPAARYQRAAELGEALEAIVGSSSIMPALGSAIGGGERTSPQALARRSVLTRGWHGLRTGLMVIGALVVVGLVVRTVWPRQSAGTELVVGTHGVQLKAPDGHELVIDGRKGLHVNDPPEHEHEGPGTLPPNTEDQLYSAVTVERTAEGLTHVGLPFDSGDEQINCHAGVWKLHESKLTCTQAGNVVAGNHLTLVPRAYLAHRYFSSNDFTAEVDVTLRQLEADFPVEANAPRFAELAFRIKDLQVSVFAVPNKGIELAWRYFTPDGTETEGDSSQDVGKLMGDEVNLPPDGTSFRLRLTLHKRKGGVDAEAFANGRRFVHKVLPGLEDQTAKVAVGCRNLHCTFDSLDVTGVERPRPEAQTAEAESK